MHLFPKITALGGALALTLSLAACGTAEKTAQGSVAPQKISIRSQRLFGSSLDTLRPEGMRDLNTRVLEKIKQDHVQSIRIVGYAVLDQQAYASMNEKTLFDLRDGDMFEWTNQVALDVQALAKRRAHAVAQHLINNGVPASMVEVEWRHLQKSLEKLSCPEKAEKRRPAVAQEHIGVTMSACVEPENRIDIEFKMTKKP